MLLKLSAGGAGFVKRSSVRLSPSVSPMQRSTAAYGGFAAERPAGRRYWLDNKQLRNRSASHSSRCGQCRVYSQGTRLNRQTCWQLSALLDLRSRTVHNTRTELNWPSYTARLLVTRISVTTWRAAAKLGRLVFTQFVRYEQTLTVGRTQFLDLSVIMNGTLAAVHPVLTIYYQNNLTLLLYRVAQTNTNLLKYLDF